MAAQRQLCDDSIVLRWIVQSTDVAVVWLAECFPLQRSALRLFFHWSLNSNGLIVKLSIFFQSSLLPLYTSRQSKLWYYHIRLIIQSRPTMFFRHVLWNICFMIWFNGCCYSGNHVEDRHLTQYYQSRRLPYLASILCQTTKMTKMKSNLFEEIKFICVIVYVTGISPKLLSAIKMNLSVGRFVR